MNRTLLSLLAFVVSIMSSTAAESAKDNRVYERRTYYCNPGKLEDLHKRFRDHTLELFKKHKIESIGYWVPMDNKEEKLIFILAYPSRDAREASWKAFQDDPAWKKAFEDSHKNGPLVKTVESIFMQPTDYSAVPKADASGNRVFEFRTYTAAPGKLDALNARFRDHTVKLFEKHGMKNIAHWTFMKDQPNADTTLFYILSHKDKAAGAASFDGFRKDPDWIKARDESQKDGSLTAPNGVKSEYFVATDYSPIR